MCSPIALLWSPSCKWSKEELPIAMFLLTSLGLWGLDNAYLPSDILSILPSLWFWEFFPIAILPWPVIDDDNVLLPIAILSFQVFLAKALYPIPTLPPW